MLAPAPSRPEPLPAGAFRPELDRRVGAFHWRAFRTLLGRELRRVWKWAAMLVLAPALMAMLYFGVFAIGLGDNRGTATGDAVLDFLVPGLVMMSILMRAAENPGFSLVYMKLEGFIIDQLMAPLGARETVPAYALAGTAAGMLSGFAVWAGAALLWWVPVEDPLMTLGFGLAGSLMMALVGMLVGIVSDKWDHISAYFTFLVMPLTFLSGAFAPVANMPEPMRLFVQANPIFYAIDGFRAGWLGTSHQDPAVSALVLAGSILAVGAVVSWLFAKGYKLKA